MISRLRRIAGDPTRTRVLGVALVLAAVLGGGIALAYWTASGAGSGAATTGVAARLVLSPGRPAPTLFPGGRGDVALVVSNPGPATATFATLTLDTTKGTGGFAVDAGHPGCGLGALGFDTQTNAGAGWTVPGRAAGVDGVLAVTLPDAVTMALDATNACQGAQFSVYLVAGS